MLLHSKFGDRLISFMSDRIWHPHPHIMNSFDFFLYGYSKEKEYTSKLWTLGDLNASIWKKNESNHTEHNSFATSLLTISTNNVVNEQNRRQTLEKKISYK